MVGTRQKSVQSDLILAAVAVEKENAVSRSDVAMTNKPQDQIAMLNESETRTCRHPILLLSCLSEIRRRKAGMLRHRNTHQQSTQFWRGDHTTRSSLGPIT